MNVIPPDPLLGRTISHYDIVAKLGGGGMGVVYKAADTKLGRTVALKFLPPQWSHDEGAKQRFLREAQAASATNHRNICVIHDISQTDDGRLFIVMAYYDGQTLKQKLEDGALPLSDALEIASEVAEGLAKAHGQGVVHRDIKSGNLMLTDDGVKVLDFGLAKFADSVQLTIPGSTVGTVAYMSPEQARGEEADARSDIWALGIVLFEMLTGEVPFKGGYPEAVFYAIKNQPLPPLRVPAGELPEALERLVLRTLEKDASKRYQSARELARDLRLLQGHTVPVDLLTGPLPPFQRPTSEPLSGSRRARGAMTPARAIAGLVVLLAVGGGLYRWFTRPVVRIPVAIAPVANHTGEPEIDAFRLALTRSLVEELEESPNLRVVSYRRLIEMIRRFVGTGDVASTEAIQAIAMQSGARFVVTPSLEYRSNDNTWFAKAEIRNTDTGTPTNTYDTDAVTSTLPKDAAYRLMSSLADAVQRHFKAHGPGRSYGRRPAGARLRDLEAAQAFEEGLNNYEQREYSAALVAFQRAASRDDQHAATQAWLSRVRLTLKQRGEAVASARRAKQLVTSETPPSDAVIIDALLAESQGDFQTAETRYRRLRSVRSDDPVAATELADFLQRQNRHREAVGVYRDVLFLDAGSIGPHVDLCVLYFRLDERPLGEQEAQSALEKYRRAGNRPGEAQALLCLGDLQRRQGGTHLADARQNISAARDIFSSLNLQYGLARVYQYLGTVSGTAGDYVAAVKYFEESLSRSRQIGNRGLEGLELMNLGVAHESLGHRAQALEYYQKSRDVFEQSGDEQAAAEQEINAALLLVDAGRDQAEALRRASNARATLRAKNSIQFELDAMRAEAASHRHAGRHGEARKELFAALSRANERQLNANSRSLTVDLSESYFLMSEYDAARKRLDEAAASEAGRDDPEVALALGRVLVRLGDLDGARGHLTRALTSVEASGYLSLAPLAHTALGELEYESENIREARVHFKKAAGYWVDDLPDAASVEASCHAGLLDTLAGRPGVARTAVERAVQQARTMGRLSVEVECRVDAARIDVHLRQYAGATALLNEISLGDDRTIGPELEAQVHYWRSRALGGRGDRSGADREATQARKLIENLRASLPLEYRDRFAARPDIRTTMQGDSVRKPQ